MTTPSPDFVSTLVLLISSLHTHNFTRFYLCTITLLSLALLVFFCSQSGNLALLFLSLCNDPCESESFIVAVNFILESHLQNQLQPRLSSAMFPVVDAGQREGSACPNDPMP